MLRTVYIVDAVITLARDKETENTERLSNPSVVTLRVCSRVKI